MVKMGGIGIGLQFIMIWVKRKKNSIIVIINRLG